MTKISVPWAFASVHASARETASVLPEQPGVSFSQ